MSKDGARVVAVAGKTNKLRREAIVCVVILPEDPCLALSVQHKVKCKGRPVTVCVASSWWCGVCVCERGRDHVCVAGVRLLESRPV